MRCGALSSFLIAVAQMAISCKTGSPQLFIIHPPLPYAPNKVRRYCTMEVKALHILWHRNLKFENNISWIAGQTCAVEFSAKNLFVFPKTCPFCFLRILLSVDKERIVGFGKVSVENCCYHLLLIYFKNCYLLKRGIAEGILKIIAIILTLTPKIFISEQKGGCREGILKTSRGKLLFKSRINLPLLWQSLMLLTPWLGGGGRITNINILKVFAIS